MAEYKSQKAGPGLVICLALVTLLFIVFAVGQFSFFEKARELTFYFDSASGIGERTHVTYAGRKCGEIRSVRILQPDEEKTDAASNRYHVLVKAMVDNSTPINRDTKAAVMMVGLLGDKQLNLTPGDPGAPALLPGEPLYGSNAGLERIAAAASKLTARLEVTLASMEALLINVNDITRDAKFKEDVKATIANARSTLEKAEATLAEAKGLISENRKNIDRALVQVHALAEKATATITNIDSTVDEARPRLVRTLDDVEKLAADLRPKVTELMQQASNMLWTANAMLLDNRTNLTLLVANGRDTFNNTRHTTRTLRYLFAPWSWFNKKNAGEEKTAIRTNDSVNVSTSPAHAGASAGDDGRIHSRLAPQAPRQPSAP
jgi:ABC-type transporter Mla subunit MlaD